MRASCISQNSREAADNHDRRRTYRPGAPMRLRHLAHTRPSPHLTAVVKRFWRQIETNPAARGVLIGLGVLLMAASPIVGPIPGPGGIIVFAAGLTLVLKYRGWAERVYVRLKR